MEDFTDSLIEEYLTAVRLTPQLLEGHQMSLFDEDEEGNLVPAAILDINNFDEKKIITLAFLDTISILKKRGVPKLRLPNIIEFMDTLGNYEDDEGNTIHNMHANNSIKWLQKFINGFIQEYTIWTINPDLDFIGNDHFSLKRNGKGDNIPDFKFTLNGQEFTLDTKIYSNLTGFKDAKITSFHKAKFILAYCMDENRYYWRTRINNDGYTYSKVCDNAELPEEMKRLVGWIKLPSTVEMLRINVPSAATDAELPEIATYEFNTYSPTNC